LLCVLGLLSKIHEKELMTLLFGPWYGIHEWEGLETEQLHPIVLDLAASEDPKKLVFAAMLGAILEDKEIEKALEKSAQPVIDTAIFGKSDEDKSKGWENTAKSLENYSNKRDEVTKKREKKGRQLITQETLDNWRKMALEKAAADDVWVFYMLTAFGAAKSESAKAVREQAILRWQQAEPNNLAPLLHQQGLSTSELFERSKTRHQFIEYNYPILRWMYQTLLQQLPNQQKSITTELIGIDSESLILAQSLLGVCKKKPPEHSSENWQSCRSIAQILRQSSSSTTISRIIGISILQALASDDAEKQILDDEYAHIKWLIKQGGQHIDGVRLFENFLLRLQDNAINSEIQAIENFLRKEGLPLKEDKGNP